MPVIRSLSAAEPRPKRLTSLMAVSIHRNACDMPRPTAGALGFVAVQNKDSPSFLQRATIDTGTYSLPQLVPVPFPTPAKPCAIQRTSGLPQVTRRASDGDGARLDTIPATIVRMETIIRRIVMPARRPATSRDLDAPAPAIARSRAGAGARTRSGMTLATESHSPRRSRHRGPVMVHDFTALFQRTRCWWTL
jgi:hypothetical protein